jgi:hypothetical protein
MFSILTNRSAANRRSSNCQPQSAARQATKALATLSAAGLFVLVGGCHSDKGPLTERFKAFQYQPPAAEPPGPPMPIDEAMQLRDFPPSYAHIPDSSLQAYSTRFPIERAVEDKYTSGEIIASDYRSYPRDLLYIGGFVGQTLALPFTYLVTPPFAKVQYFATRYEPTYTAMPPMDGTAPGAAATSKGPAAAPAAPAASPAEAPAPAAPAAAPEGNAPAAPTAVPPAAPEATPGPGAAPSGTPGTPGSPGSPSGAAVPEGAPGAPAGPSAPRLPPPIAPDVNPTGDAPNK